MENMKKYVSNYNIFDGPKKAPATVRFTRDANIEIIRVSNGDDDVDFFGTPVAPDGPGPAAREAPAEAAAPARADDKLRATAFGRLLEDERRAAAPPAAGDGARDGERARGGDGGGDGGGDDGASSDDGSVARSDDGSVALSIASTAADSQSAENRREMMTVRVRRADGRVRRTLRVPQSTDLELLVASVAREEGVAAARCRVKPRDGQPRPRPPRAAAAGADAARRRARTAFERRALGLLCVVAAVVALLAGGLRRAPPRGGDVVALGEARSELEALHAEITAARDELRDARDEIKRLSKQMQAAVREARRAAGGAEPRPRRANPLLNVVTLGAAGRRQRRRRGD